MNRRMFAAILAVPAIALAVTACGKKSAPVETTAATTEATVQTTAATTEPTVETLEVLYDPQVEDWEDETTAPASSTKATDPTESTKATDPTTKPTDATKPDETKPEGTKPEDTKPEETQPTATKPAAKDPLAQEYEAYLNMTPEQQQAKYEKMGAAKFMDWYQRAKAAYEASQDYIDISGGEIDLGQLG